MMHKKYRLTHVKKGGFIATTAVMLLSMGAFVFMLTALSAALAYADSVDKREARIQKNLNMRACDETRPLLIAKDYFIHGQIELHDFGCILQF